MPKNNPPRGPIGYTHFITIRTNDNEYIGLQNSSSESLTNMKKNDPIFNKMVATLTLK